MRLERLKAKEIGERPYKKLFHVVVFFFLFFLLFSFVFTAERRREKEEEVFKVQKLRWKGHHERGNSQLDSLKARGVKGRSFHVTPTAFRP